jgi:catechol 2,3-dioxygenase-like lactoylglutathione lyase family enzyme
LDSSIVTVTGVSAKQQIDSCDQNRWARSVVVCIVESCQLANLPFADPAGWMPRSKEENLVPKLVRIAPEIPVSNLRESIDYYEKKLGFRLAMQMPEGDYAIVERDDVAIHLYHDDDGGHSPASIHVFTHGLEELSAELQQRGAQVSQEIVRQPWRNRDFRVKDPWGNEIKFTEPRSGDE